MAATIKIEQELNSVAANMQQYAELVKGYVSSFEEIAAQVPSYWAGSDADSFVKKVNEIIPELKKYQQSYETFSDYLTKVYPIYEAYEQSYNRNIDCN